MKDDRTRLLTILTGLLLTGAGSESAWAREFRVNQLPNGRVMGCANCHLSPGGGGPRTPFGNRVFQIIGGSPGSVLFWSASLAAEDSDGDTYCNGQELRDPDGDGTPVSAVGVTNPGVGTSRPANTPPAFASTPIPQAIMGLPYQYQATATDEDGCQGQTFSKVDGPAWLSVTADGLVSGTPPDGLGGDTTVTVQVQDNGTPTSQTAAQTYTLAIIASYAGWQALNFTLPAEAHLAGQTNDADGDGLLNALEYAYRTNPRAVNTVPPPVPVFNANDQMSVSFVWRDDDPALTGRMEVADALGFSPITNVTGTVTDPTPGDGLRTWTFVDPVARTSALARFGRILLELQP